MPENLIEPYLIRVSSVRSLSNQKFSMKVSNHIPDNLVLTVQIKIFIHCNQYITRIIIIFVYWFIF